jgi:hypothetical protein
MNELEMLFYAFPFLFIGMWFTITRVLMRASGMTQQLEIVAMTTRMALVLIEALC